MGNYFEIFWKYAPILAETTQKSVLVCLQINGFDDFDNIIYVENMSND